MKQGSNQRRGRARGNGKRFPHGGNRSFESAGPDVKVRGTAQQVLERYLAMARDASAAGDRVAAESFYQYADHYYRIVNAEREQREQRYAQSPAPMPPGNGQTHEAPPGDEPQPTIAEADETEPRSPMH